MERCKLYTCTRAPYVEASCQVYNYCGRRHAAKASFLATLARNYLIQSEIIFDMRGSNLLKLLEEKLNGRQGGRLLEVDFWAVDPWELPGFEGVNAEGNHDNQGPLAFFSRPAEPISPPGPDGRPRHNRQTMQGGWSGDGRVQAVPGVSRGSVKYFTWWKSIGGRLEQKTGWTMHELYFEDRPELHLYKVFHKVAKRKSSSRPRTREAAMQEEADDDDASPSCNASAQAHPELWSAGNDPAAVPAMCGSASPVMLEGTLQENLAQRQRLAYFGTGPHVMASLADDRGGDAAPGSPPRLPRHEMSTPARALEGTTVEQTTQCVAPADRDDPDGGVDFVELSDIEDLPRLEG